MTPGTAADDRACRHPYLRDARRMALADGPGVHEPREELNRLARSAAFALEVPFTLITIIGAELQWVIGAHGLVNPLIGERWSPLQGSISKYVVIDRRPVVLGDRRLDRRLSRVDSEYLGGMIAYAGVPLVTADGYAIGAACAIDMVPHRWTTAEVTVLTDVATAAMDVLAPAASNGRAVVGGRSLP